MEKRSALGNSETNAEPIYRLHSYSIDVVFIAVFDYLLS